MSAAELRRVIDGFRASQVIHAAAALGLADLVGDESRTSDELAAAAEADPVRSTVCCAPTLRSGSSEKSQGGASR
jgi:hypothetical protein